MRELTIGKNDAGQRLDRFLSKALPLLPPALAQKYIRIKRVKVQNKEWIDTAGARYTDDLDICRIIRAVCTRKVCTCIRTPVTAECDDFRFEFLIYLHIASTSAII